MQEIFKDIIGYEGSYQVSNLGNVKSLNYRNKKGNGVIIKYQLGEKLYYFVGLSKNNIIRHIKIHRLVAQAFIPNPENKPCINHINGIKTDNRVENLEWVTYSENQKHSYQILGRVNPQKGKFGYKHCHSRKILQFTLNNILIKEWGSIIDASIELYIHKCNIQSVCSGRTKTAGGFIWKYNSPELKNLIF